MNIMNKVTNQKDARHVEQISLWIDFLVSLNAK
jgi:hypothetical protein